MRHGTNLRRPVVGLNPTTPHMAAGRRMLPPMSVPKPRGEPHALMRAASPPLDPWGVRSVLSGFKVTPLIGLPHSVLTKLRKALVMPAVGSNVRLGIYYVQAKDYQIKTKWAALAQFCGKIGQDTLLHAWTHFSFQRSYYQSCLRW